MDTIAQNVANVDTTRAKIENGRYVPYRRRMVVVQEDKANKPFSAYLSESSKALEGVKVTRIVEDYSTPFKTVYDPSHPDADEQGNVLMPNVDILNEMVDMISATRSYEANVTVLNGSKNMAMKALEIGK